jgi:hypothetical protein
MAAGMLGGAAPALAVEASPLQSLGKVPNHTSAGTSWIPVLSVIVAAVAAFGAVATWWGTRQTRIDRRLAHLEAIRNDPTEQARRIRVAEYSMEAVVTKVKGIHAEISTMADIRDSASVDPARPIRLDSAAFALNRFLFTEYESHVNRYRDDLRDLKQRLAQCQDALRSIVSGPWPIQPSYVSYQLLTVEDGQRRLTADSGIVLNEAATIIGATLDSVMSLKAQMTVGGNEAGATKSP